MYRLYIIGYTLRKRRNRNDDEKNKTFANKPIQYISLYIGYSHYKCGWEPRNIKDVVTLAIDECLYMKSTATAQQPATICAD